MTERVRRRICGRDDRYNNHHDCSADRSAMDFETKQQARDFVWSRLEEVGVARFPFPVQGRIPNFAGAQEAAERLGSFEAFVEAETLKVNPDSPQKYVRKLALQRGKTVVVPTPKLKAGFLLFDPDEIDADDYEDASMLSRWEPFAREIELDELPDIDLIVTGCVAVTREGKRAGKGHGYSDLEYGILRELGHDPVGVVTTVHDEQIVDGFPVDDHDIHLSAVATPQRLVDIDDRPGGPAGIDWELLDDEDLESMPVLEALKRRS